MSHFTIEMLSDQCGVTMPNLRAWQRYGLLKPARDASGKRYYDYSHLLRIQLILKWLNEGVPVAEVSRLLKGEHATLSSQWELYQEKLLSALENPDTAKLRALLRRFGRELPAAALLDNVIRPLRLWLREGVNATQLTRRARFDTQLIEYAAFVLQGLRKRPADSLVMIPLNMTDPLDIWLEAIRFSAEGFRIDLLAEPVAQPDLDELQAEHYFLWSDAPLTPLQQVMVQHWQSEGRPLFTGGAGFSAPAQAEAPVSEATTAISDAG
ncbi:MerR family transcriptional regulator [Franconibacter helveticus 513]|uniref:MerR family transcriptional regulator n=1 Tax=Franconibacter helveticus TaxID=357240 RepID=UPI00040F137D|nr:MerR family transcriptional regulator [Franconibacter helveticus]MDU6924268.1 MerR family transcriptional regulator [Franconibacter helveticus]